MSNHLEKIKEKIMQFSSLPEDEWEAFSDRLVIKKFKRGDFLVAQGQVENYMYFLNSGSTRNYFLHDGNEFTIDFHFGGDFVSGFYSFITRDPSYVTIELLEDSETVAISYTDLHHFYRNFHNGERTGRLITEMQYARRLRKEMDLLALTADERYAQLIERNPRLVNEISVKHLSSYLGIQPESLSRIRKRFARN